MIINILTQLYLLMVYATINSLRAKAASIFSCDNTDTCLLSGSVVTCTCTVEDESGISLTLWDGSAFMSQCPGVPDRIILAHILGLTQPIQCGRISAVLISQEVQTYTSNATITVTTSNNGSSIRCSMGGPPPVGMIVLNVGETPPTPNNLTIPLESLNRERYSLTWTEPINVFGGVGSHRVMVRSDQGGDTTMLCGHMTAPNGEASPLREFTDWATDGQMCYFNVTTVTGDNCNFVSTPSQEVAITLQGPHQELVEKVILDNPVYVDNHLQIVDISFMYTQESPIVIIDGVTSVTTHFSITYSYSGNESCTMIIPLSCDQQQWCNYTLTLDNCPTMISGNGMFSVVPLNIIGSGITRNSDLIANRNPLFTVTDLNSSSKSFQLKFQATFTVAGCFFQYGLVSSMECTNFTLNTTVASANSDVIVINVTLPQNGRYCYRVNCTVAPNPMHFAPIAQGMFEYQLTTVPTAASGDTFPLWVIAVIIIIAVIFAVIIIVIITLAIVWKIKSKGNCENRDRRGAKEESVAHMPEYEEVTTQPTTSSEAFEMGENVAYGPVLKNRAS